MRAGAVAGQGEWWGGFIESSPSAPALMPLTQVSRTRTVPVPHSHMHPPSRIALLGYKKKTALHYALRFVADRATRRLYFQSSP